MKMLINVVGVLLIIFGVTTLAYQRITYTKQEDVAQIGTLKITADSQKTVRFPPILGGASIVVGLVLVIIGRRSK